MPAIQNNSSIVIKLGRGISAAGLLTGGIQMANTLVACYNGDNISSAEILNIVSIALTGAGFLFSGIPFATPILGFLGCVVGIIASLLETTVLQPTLINIQLNDGANILVLIA